MDSVQLPVDDAPAVSDAGCTSAILLLNMQGMSPAANSTSRWKIPAVSESLLNDKNTHVPFMCITESWLKGYITKAQVKIENYESVRADREIRSRGGALIYVRDNLVISNELIYDNGICEAAATCIDTLRAVVVCIYRPPDATQGSFTKLLSRVQEYLDACDSSYTKYVTGDFNFPFIDWKSLEVKNTHGQEKSQSATNLLNFVARNFLSQIATMSTREATTLDLMLVSHPQLISEVYAEDTTLSDHKLVVAKLTFDARNPTPNRQPPQFDPHSFRALDIHKADLTSLNNSLSNVDWPTLLDECKDTYGPNCVNEYAELIRLITLQLAVLHIPRKKPPSGKRNTQRQVLFRKKRKLNARLRCIKQNQPNSPTIAKIDTELNLLEYQIREQITNELINKEEMAVSKITTNPSYFFRSAKRPNGFLLLNLLLGLLKNLM